MGEHNTVNYVENFLPFASTWHLTKVTSPNADDFINLTYVNENIKYMTSHGVDVRQENLDLYQDNLLPPEANKYYGTFRRPTSPSTFVDESGTTITRPYTNPPVQIAIPYLPQNVTISTAFNTITAKRLLQITSAAGDRIDFVATTPRSDLVGANRLDRIDIVNRQNQTVKSTRFSYEYTLGRPLSSNVLYDQYQYWFPAPGQNNSIAWFPITEWGLDANASPPPPVGQVAVFSSGWLNHWTPMADADYWRMFLGKIIESYGVNRDIDVYEFKYNYDPDKILPRRLSFSQDHWGYFNNNQVGHTIPKMLYQTWWGQENSGNSVWLDNPNTLLAAGTTNLAISFRQTVLWNTSSNEPVDPDPNLAGANRSADLLKTQAGIMTEVWFPTGSKKKFTYELNRTTSNAIVGGLRIATIDTYPDRDLTQFERIQYQYFGGQTAYTSISYHETWDNDPLNIQSIRNSLTKSSQSITPVQLTQGGVIGYARAEESRSGLGKKTYYFMNSTSNPNVAGPIRDVYNAACATCPNYAPFTDVDHMRGLIEKVEVLSSTNKLLQREINTYEINPAGFTTKLTYGLKPGVKSQFNSGNPLDNRKQYGSFYGYRFDFISLKQKSIETFDQADPGNELKKITTLTDFSYIPQGKTNVSTDLLPRKIIQAMPSGEKLIQEFKYPLDYSVSSSATNMAARGIYALKEKKIESPAIEQISYLEKVDGTKNMVAGSLLHFREFPASSGKVYPWQVFKLKAGTGDLFTSFPWSTVNSDVFTYNSSGYKLTRSFTNYDASGNTLNQISEDGTQTDYTWGYNASLLTSHTTNTGAFQHQTQYTQTPLVGVTQITDSNSRNIKFSYDGFSRLSVVRDHDNQIESRYRYNYKDESLKRPDFTYTQLNDQTFRFDCIKGTEPGAQLIWDFGNGTVLENAQTTVSHTYSGVGQFTVTLCVTYPDNPTATVSKPLVILPPVNIQFTSPVSGTNYTVCGTANVTLQATPTGAGPYSFQWEHNYSGWGNSNYLPIGTNSTTLNYNNQTGVQNSSRSIRCRITDNEGRSRYSNYAIIFHYCSGQPGPTDCGPGCYWDPIAGNCNCQSTCGDGCFWSGFECVCY